MGHSVSNHLTCMLDWLGFWWKLVGIVICQYNEPTKIFSSLSQLLHIFWPFVDGGIVAVSRHLDDKSHKLSTLNLNISITKHARKLQFTEFVQFFEQIHISCISLSYNDNWALCRGSKWQRNDFRTILTDRSDQLVRWLWKFLFYTNVLLPAGYQKSQIRIYLELLGSLYQASQNKENHFLECSAQIFDFMFHHVG